MDRIVLHAPAMDEAGLFCDAGTELRVADQIAEGDNEAPSPAAGTIASERAGELIAAGGAVDPDAPAPAVDESPQQSEALDPLDHDGDGRKAGRVPNSRRQ